MRRRNHFSGWDDRLIEGFLSLLTGIAESTSATPGPHVKFVGYFELLDLLKQPACPVCSIINRSLRHYVGVVFVEQLTDPAFRGPLQESLGYCAKHSEFVFSIARKRLPRMGVAVVYNELLEIVEKKLEAGGEVPIPLDCMMCDIESDLQDYACQLIADHSGDQEFRTQFLSSGGVCIPHMRSIAAKINGDGPRFFFAAQKQILQRERAYLHDFIKKHDYKSSREVISEREGSSWKRAVHLLVGEH